MKKIGFRNLVLDKIYNLLNENKLNYLCINGPFYFKDYSGDIDILIDKRQIKIATKIIKGYLNTLDNIFFLERKTVSTNAYFNSKFLIENKNEISSILQIDILDSYHWKGFIYADYNNLKKYTYLDEKEISILDPKISNYLGSIKDTLLKNKISPKRKDKTFSEKAYISFLCSIGFNKNSALSFYYKKSLIENKYLFLLMWIKNISMDKYKRLMDFYINQISAIFKGFYKNRLIAFYGPDGSGKSFLIKKILEREILFKYFDEIKFKHTSNKKLPPLSFYKRLIKIENKYAKKTLRSTKPLNQVHAIIFSIYYSFDYFFEKLIITSEIFRKKRILYIYDRYAYEQTYQHTFNKLPLFFLHILKKVNYKALVNFFIFANPKIILARKKELTIHEINEQISKYAKADKLFNLESKFIDNSSNNSIDTANKILETIISKL